MLEVERPTKRYDGTWAVRDLGSAIRPGQVPGLLGSTGACSLVGQPTGAWAALPAAAAAAAVVLAEARLRLRWPGERLERTDPLEAGVGV